MSSSNCTFAVESMSHAGRVVYARASVYRSNFKFVIIQSRGTFLTTTGFYLMTAYNYCLTVVSTQQNMHIIRMLMQDLNEAMEESKMIWGKHMGSSALWEGHRQRLHQWNIIMKNFSIQQVKIFVKKHKYSTVFSIR
jgi:hypothetical protein